MLKKIQKVDIEHPEKYAKASDFAEKYMDEALAEA